MTRETALRRLENRTEQLVRLVMLGAPEIMLEKQRDLVSRARGWVDNPPPEEPDLQSCLLQRAFVRLAHEPVGRTGITILAMTS